MNDRGVRIPGGNVCESRMSSVTTEGRDHRDGFDGPWWRYPVLRNGLMAGALAGAAFVLAHLGLISSQTEGVFYLLAIPLGGYHWGLEAVKALVRERVIGIDLLMLAATVGSGILGLWDEAAFLVFLYGSAEGLEEYTYARTRSAIRALLDLAPKEAHILRNRCDIPFAPNEVHLYTKIVRSPRLGSAECKTHLLGSATRDALRPS